MNHKAGIPPVTKPIKKSDLTDGTITAPAEIEPTIEIELEHSSLTGTVRAILESTRREEKVDK